MVLALLDLGTQVLIMIIALVLLLEPNILLSQIQWGIAPTWGQFLYGLAIGTVAYTGIETISNMAEEAHHPGKDVPRSINFVIVAVLVVYIGMPLAALSSMKVGLQHGAGRPGDRQDRARCEVVPGEPEGTYRAQVRSRRSTVYVPLEKLRGRHHDHPAQEPTGDGRDRRRRSRSPSSTAPSSGSNYVADPVLGMVRFLPDNVAWLRWILGPWVGILAATILFIATNAGIIGVSRLAFSLGQHRQLPRVLGRVHPTRLTPYVAIVALRRHRRDPHLARRDPAAGGPLRLRLDDLVHRRARLGDHAAAQGAGSARGRSGRRSTSASGACPCPSPPCSARMGTFSVWCVILYYKPLSGLIGIAWVARRASSPT